MQHLEWLARDRLLRFELQLGTISRSEFLPASTSNALKAIEFEVQRLRGILDEVMTYEDQTFLLRHAVLINQKLNSLQITSASFSDQQIFETRSKPISLSRKCRES